MDRIIKGMTRAGQPTGSNKKAKWPGKVWVPNEHSNEKGAMREPSQSPGEAQGELEEVKEALQELEENKGDWSKGGG